MTIFGITLTKPTASDFYIQIIVISALIIVDTLLFSADTTTFEMRMAFIFSISSGVILASMGVNMFLGFRHFLVLLLIGIPFGYVGYFIASLFAL